MKNVDLLRKIGLNKYQGAIYLSLIEQGAMTVAGISRASGLYRPVIYKHLSVLKEMGLVTSVIKGEQKHYMAQSPENLRDLIHGINFEFEQSLPELERIFAAQGQQSVVKFFYGKKGISLIFKDLVTSMPKESVYYRFTSFTTKRPEGFINKYIPKDYKEMRDRKRLDRFVINNEKAAEKMILGREVKTISEEMAPFDYDINQIIYGDKVAYMDFNSDTAILIENKKIADFQRTIFKLLYKYL